MIKLISIILNLILPHSNADMDMCRMKLKKVNEGKTYHAMIFARQAPFFKMLVDKPTEDARMVYKEAVDACIHAGGRSHYLMSPSKKILSCDDYVRNGDARSFCEPTAMKVPADKLLEELK